MAFGLQDSMDFGGTQEAFDSTGNSGIISDLENIGVNFAAGAATVGLGALSKSAGVSVPYGSALTPYNITQRPGTLVPPISPISSNTILLGGVLIAGLLVFIALRGKKGA